MSLLARLAVIVALLLPVAARGQPSPITPATALPLGYQQITSLGSAASLTVPVGATQVLIVAETQSVRWRDDGIAPTASVGMLLPAGQFFYYKAGPLTAIQFIQTTATATLDVSYYK